MKSFFFILLFWSLIAVGAEFPVRKGNTEIIVVEDPNVEMALRSKFYNEARRSIDVITLTQGMDPLGIEMALGLRSAAERGVPARSIYDEFASKNLAQNKNDAAGALLADSSLKMPVQVVAVTGAAKKKMNWSKSLDFFHEKIVIIDAGTPEELILVGGRNQLQCDLCSRDFGFIIRPINPSEPYVGTDLKAHYERIWDTAARYAGVRKPAPLPAKVLAAVKKHGSLELLKHPTQTRQFDTITQLLERSPGSIAESELSPIQFRPGQTQLVTNDVLFQATQSKSPKSLKARLELQNDILMKVIGKLATAKRMDFISYVVNMHPKLLTAAQDFLARGGDFRIFTNGRSALRDVYVGDAMQRVVGGLLGIQSSPADLTYRGIGPLFEASAGASSSNFQFNALDSEPVKALPEPANSQIYQHKKVVVVDNTTGFGSDNFTQASHARNTELMVFAEDPRFAQYVRDHFAEQEPLFQKMDVTQVENDFRKRPLLSDFCQMIFRQMY